MKIVYSLTCLLFVGILSSSNAAHELESLCANNGGPKAYENLQTAVIEMQSCAKIMVEDWTAQVHTSEGKMDPAFELYCKRVGNLKNCTKRLASSLKTCLETGQHKVIDIAYNMSASLLDFGCENSKLFQDALTSKDRPCFDSKLPALESCLNGLTATYNVTVFDQSGPPVTDPIGTLSKIKTKFDNKECRQIEEAEECTVKVLKQCEDKTFSEILDSLWKHMNNNIPCNNLTKSAASPVGIANMLLLFIASIVMTL